MKHCNEELGKEQLQLILAALVCPEVERGWCSFSKCAMLIISNVLMNYDGFHPRYYKTMKDPICLLFEREKCPPAINSCLKGKKLWTCFNDLVFKEKGADVTSLCVCLCSCLSLLPVVSLVNDPLQINLGMFIHTLRCRHVGTSGPLPFHPSERELAASHQPQVFPSCSHICIGEQWCTLDRGFCWMTSFPLHSIAWKLIQPLECKTVIKISALIWI